MRPKKRKVVSLTVGEGGSWESVADHRAREGSSADVTDLPAAAPEQAAEPDMQQPTFEDIEETFPIEQQQQQQQQQQHQPPLLPCDVDLARQLSNAVLDNASSPLLYVSADAREAHFLIPHLDDNYHHTEKRFGVVALRVVKFQDASLLVSWCSNCPCGASGPGGMEALQKKDFEHVSSRDFFGGTLPTLCAAAAAFKDLLVSSKPISQTTNEAVQLYFYQQRQHQQHQHQHQHQQQHLHQQQEQQEQQEQQQEQHEQQQEQHEQQQQQQQQQQHEQYPLVRPIMAFDAKYTAVQPATSFSTWGIVKKETNSQWLCTTCPSHKRTCAHVEALPAAPTAGEVDTWETGFRNEFDFCRGI